MIRRRGRAALAASLALVIVLVACAPAPENGDTVPEPTVVPLPASIEAIGGAPFVLDDRVRIGGDPDAAAALAALVEARTGLSVGASSSGGAGIELRVDRDGAAESYRITADEASVIISGADAAGLFYGVQTFGQLVARDGDRWVVPAVEIDDAPRFAYRGVMLDVARHFFPVETVKAYIDRAASLKFNALHLHLSDDQGWRLQLDSRPELTEKASDTEIGGGDGGFFTKDDYREIVAYAASRHLIVVPELDMPSHTHAVGLAYPELAEDPVITDAVRETVVQFHGALPKKGEPYEGLAVGFSSLKIHDEATYDFVADVFGELAAMTPGPYLHFGGDEAHGTAPEDFAEFVERTSRIIADLGKTPIAWHEAGAAPDLSDETIGQYWGYTTPTDGMDDKARAFVANGSKVILAPADAAYLDMKYDAGTALGLQWANGPTSVRRAYSWEPGGLIEGIGDDEILGVEAPLWSETLRTASDIDAMAFPRIAAIAEAGWSPATGTNHERTWRSFRERVGRLGPLWTSLGIGFTAADGIVWVTE
ncbi:family 20 glycosylhydrolase [Microbacterium sp. BWT-B31]|uniref:family 20 glycosylhydrolase n=1 Tax=Microbacterium sp. BWT-B31 TaxID=3232072 RepID=UPI003528D394